MSCCRQRRFLEHDDIYRGGGHQYLILGPKLVEPPGECRNNHEVICALAARLGAEHRGFTMSPRELIDQMLQVSKRGTLAETRGEPLARLPAAVPGIALSRWLSLGRTANSASRRIGPMCRSAVPTGAVQSLTCRHCRITGLRSSRRMRSIHSASQRRRRAVFSIRPSMRRRPR